MAVEVTTRKSVMGFSIKKLLWIMALIMNVNILIHRQSIFYSKAILKENMLGKYNAEPKS